MAMLKLILSWIKKNVTFLLGGMALILMIVCFVSGCNYHKNRHESPEVNSDTTENVNPNVYKIIDSLQTVIDSLMSLPPEIRDRWLPQDTFYTPPDTFFKDVDTAAILKNHYSVYRYHWYKLDTGKLKLDLWTTVTRNMPIKYELDYQILQPQQTIINTQDNSVHYAKYIYGGIDLPLPDIEFTSVDVLYAFSRGYLGVGYIPLQKGVSLKTGIRLFKFK